MSPEPYVRYAVDPQGVATVEFGTPAHNSLPSPQLAQLAAALRRAGADPDCRSIVLRSGGNRTFCAGASLTELQAIDSEGAGATFFGGFAAVLEAMRTCPKFIVGRVQGKAVGGGVGLVAACDLAYGSAYAAVRLSELAIGIGAFVIAPALRRRIGTAGLTRLSLHPKDFLAADEARDLGLYAAVLPDAAALDAAVLAKANELAGYGVEATAAWKHTLWSDAAHWPELLAERAAISGRLVTLRPAREALARL